MRFIVDLYRLLILLGLAATIIAFVYVCLKVATMPELGSDVAIDFAAVAILLLMLMVIGLGLTATIISIHDRHSELVDEVRNLNDHLRGQP